MSKGWLGAAVFHLWIWSVPASAQVLMIFAEKETEEEVTLTVMGEQEPAKKSASVRVFDVDGEIGKFSAPIMRKKSWCINDGGTHPRWIGKVTLKKSALKGKIPPKTGELSPFLVGVVGAIPDPLKTNKSPLVRTGSPAGVLKAFKAQKGKRPFSRVWMVQADGCSFQGKTTMAAYFLEVSGSKKRPASLVCCGP